MANLELGHLERDLARRCGESALVVAGAVSGALVGALVGPGADEPVGLLVERGNRLGHGLSPGMIEFGAQVIPTARAMSFFFWTRLAFMVSKNAYAIRAGYPNRRLRKRAVS